MTNKDFNIIITGVGGQGLITLVRIISEAVFMQGYDVKSSELHGLSQRGGSVIAHIKFGKKVYSPLVSQGKADIIIGLELSEGLRGATFANQKTKILINERYLFFEGSLPKEKILANIKKIFENNLYLISASEICKNKLQNEVVSSIYILGYAVHKKLIPLEPKLVLKAIEKVIPKKYSELNKQALNLANS